MGVGLSGTAGNTITIKSEMEEGLSCLFWILILWGGYGGNNAIPECINLWLVEAVRRERGIWGFYDGKAGMKETRKREKEWRATRWFGVERKRICLCGKAGNMGIGGAAGIAQYRKTGSKWAEGAWEGCGGLKNKKAVRVDSLDQERNDNTQTPTHKNLICKFQLQAFSLLFKKLL